MIRFRFFLTLLRCAPKAIFCLVPRSNYMIAHKEKYDAQARFDYCKKILKYITRKALTITEYFGKENLPDSNYILYSNHQGKYDAIGILQAFDKPTSVLWEKRQAKKFLSRQASGLLDAIKIDLGNIRAQFEAIQQTIEYVNNGGSILIFPEGTYGPNENKIQQFHAGCFRCSIKTKTPIVPVCIWDSWKSMNSRSLKWVTTQVYFLKAIPYEEYKDMNKEELCILVESRIKEKLAELEEIHS